MRPGNVPVLQSGAAASRRASSAADEFPCLFHSQEAPGRNGAKVLRKTFTKERAWPGRSMPKEEAAKAHGWVDRAARMRGTRMTQAECLVLPEMGEAGSHLHTELQSVHSRLPIAHAAFLDSSGVSVRADEWHTRAAGRDDRQTQDMTRQLTITPISKTTWKKIHTRLSGIF